MEETRADRDSVSSRHDHRTVSGIEALVEITGDREIDVDDSVVHRRHERRRYPDEPWSSAPRSDGVGTVSGADDGDDSGPGTDAAWSPGTDDGARPGTDDGGPDGGDDGRPPGVDDGRPDGDVDGGSAGVDGGSAGVDSGGSAGVDVGVSVGGAAD